MPGSKSLTHRALWLAGQAEGESRITGALDAADTQATIRCLRAWGAEVEGDGQVLRVVGRRPRPFAADCGNSGTTLRLAAATAARFEGTSRLDGDASLRRRSVAPLAEALRSADAVVSSDHAPLQVHGPMRPGDHHVHGSSQHASALMLTLPMLDGPSSLRITDTPSLGYTELTRDVAKVFGIRTGPGPIEGGQEVHAASFDVEPDLSSAANVLAAAALTGTSVHIPRLHAHSNQPDAAILQILADFGISTYANPVRVAGPMTALPEHIDVSACPDLFPVACALVAGAGAAALRGATRIQGTRQLREKESDRIAAMAEGLRRLKVRVDEAPDAVTIHAGALTPGRVQARGDHRIQMAFGILSLIEPDIQIMEPDRTGVSFPGFWAALQRFHEVHA